MLYEFASGSLAPHRAKEMREYLEGCRESQREFEKLSRGNAFAKAAAGTRVSPALREALLNFEPPWQKQLRIWTLWSSTRGWQMLPYIVLILTIGAGTVVFKPWQKTETPDVLLAEQLRTEPDMVAPPSGGEQPTPLPQPAPAMTPPVIAANPQPTPVNPAPQSAPTPAVPSVVKSPSVREDTSDDKVAAPVTARGFIMRATMGVSDFGNTWPMIREKIIALGGKVAGNVELGWLRRPDQSYFHFTIPESNYPELELFLGTFGPVQFTKERHPRVMPEGQIRIILTVKDVITDESPPQTP